MMDSAHALLEQCIDYAGVFPPADLALDESLENYLGYLEQPDAWLLGRFVCPASKLAQLSSRAREFRKVRPSCEQSMAVIGNSATTLSNWLAEFQRDIEAIVGFQRIHNDHVSIDSLELKLPELHHTDIDESLAALIHAVDQSIGVNGRNPIMVLFEIGALSDTGPSVLDVLHTIELHGFDHFGLKLRMGGSPGQKTLTPDEVAYFIDVCRASQTRWKATAGLHHPLSQFEAATDAWSFGFLNVLVAGVFAVLHRLEPEQLQQILTETSIRAFAFSDDSLEWDGYRATVAEIEQARLRGIDSFGSCNFDEPRDGLHQLTLIA